MGRHKVRSPCVEIAIGMHNRYNEYCADETFVGSVVMNFIIVTSKDSHRLVLLNIDDISNIVELSDGASIQMKTRSSVFGRYDILVSDTIQDITKQLLEITRTVR